MAESQTDALAEYKAELDSMLTDVMPDSWEGFGRLEIAERNFNPEKESVVRQVFGSLSEKYPDVDGEKLAERAIKAVEKKMD